MACGLDPAYEAIGSCLQSLGALVAFCYTFAHAYTRARWCGAAFASEAGEVGGEGGKKQWQWPGQKTGLCCLRLKPSCTGLWLQSIANVFLGVLSSGQRQSHGVHVHVQYPIQWGPNLSLGCLILLQHK